MVSEKSLIAISMKNVCQLVKIKYLKKSNVLK